MRMTQIRRTARAARTETVATTVMAVAVGGATMDAHRRKGGWPRREAKRRRVRGGREYGEGKGEGKATGGNAGNEASTGKGGACDSITLYSVSTKVNQTKRSALNESRHAVTLESLHVIYSSIVHLAGPI